MKPGLGDWKAKIKSGEIAARRPAAAARRDPPVAARAVRRLGLRAAPRGRSRASERRAQGLRRRPGLQPGPRHRRLHPHAARPVAAGRRVRGDLRRRRLDRRDAGAARRARRRARARARRAHPELRLARPAAQRRDRAGARRVRATSSTTTTSSGDEALERMHAMAVRDDADIVIGKVVGHGKSVPRNLFRRNRTRRRPAVGARCSGCSRRTSCSAARSSTRTTCASRRAGGGSRTTCS